MVLIYLDVDGVLLPHPPAATTVCGMCGRPFFGSNGCEQKLDFSNTHVEVAGGGALCKECVVENGYEMAATLSEFPNRCMRAWA